MKHKRIITIKDPRLRKIRNEFRNLWLAAYGAEWRRLNDKLEDLSFDEDENILTIADMRRIGTLERFRSLQKAQSDLDVALRRSICSCSSCGRADVDMYYNKPYNSWFCLGCVQKIINGYANIITKKALGTYYCDEDDDDNDFEESFI